MTESWKPGPLAREEPRATQGAVEVLVRPEHKGPEPQPASRIRRPFTSPASPIIAGRS